MGNRWDGVQTKHVGLGKRQGRQQQYLTRTKVVGLISKKSCTTVRCVLCNFISVTQLFLGGDLRCAVALLGTVGQMRRRGRGEHNIHLKLLHPGKRYRIQPAARECKKWYGYGIQCDHKVGDGFNTFFNARDPLNPHH